MRLLEHLACLAFIVVPATAQTTEDLLAELATTAPTIEAAEAEARAAKADLWAARGALLPQLSVQAQAQSLEETLRINGVPGELTAARDPNAVSLEARQVLFASGSLAGSIGAAKASARAAGYASEAVRQDALLRGVEAIAAVVRDRAVLRQRVVTEEVARSRLNETFVRERAGLATKTDRLQAEARLKLAEAERITARGALRASDATFARVFGRAAPRDLDLPKANVELPSTLDEALAEAFAHSPELFASDEQRRAARQRVRATRGEALPQISLRASAAQIDNERFGVELGEAEQYAIGIEGRWTLFSGGSSLNRTRASARRAEAAASDAMRARRLVRERVVQAFAAVETGQARLAAFEAQARAATEAAIGVASEARSGRRTRLDVLDADREKTAADVALLTARTELAVAEHALLRAMGMLLVPSAEK